jgi:hypothetical protein
MPRQKLIVYFLTSLALAGFIMYFVLPKESEYRLLGIVLMIFCLPLAMREARKYARAQAPVRSAPPLPPAFGPRHVHVLLEVTFSRLIPTSQMQVDQNLLELRCLLALGSDGYTIRLWRADGVSGPWPDAEPLRMNAQFLVPERALAKFPAGTHATLVLGNVNAGAASVVSQTA